MRTLLVVDAANVIGSVPDGWWRDRHGAAERLRDSLVPYADSGVPGRPGPAEVVLVVEGAARTVPSVPGVRTVAARGSGDDAIVEVVRAEAPGRDCVVITADRGLRERVRALGAEVSGPRAVRPEAGGPDGPDGSGGGDGGSGTGRQSRRT
ncbi:NTP pyrophosphohydrolase [Streptomyces armeniacus]|uniref:NTP pyrophosphohydrolase n=1 Tax=Streptomyces armeniacus TaxID=83291 RepID=A0A345XMM3_9ACTN|nr:NTP pyrophosphohydrolase [Streptomyces armeniacus]AXK32889.1 NTP pyrophosphohydrolase [Streptomyces armeniacus]